jgi:anti-sigma regulatory factor (Ser/Thr protein kinase)
MQGGPSSPDHPGESVLLDRLFDLDTLHVTRDAVRASLPMDELGHVRGHGFLTAISEGLSNAIKHGGGSGRLLLARLDNRLVATVENVQPTVAFAFPQVEPPPAADRGRGLWLVRRLCDAARIESGGARLRLVMELAISGR